MNNLETLSITELFLSMKEDEKEPEVVHKLLNFEEVKQILK